MFQEKIRINVVASGFIETQWQIDKPVEIKKNIENKIALHRLAAIQKTDSIIFCIKNSYINGSILYNNGGYNFQ
ncbi:MAG: SDR family oxidoreductase [Bacteroidales bacterium]|jgi:3-oxoacyl-[acyl-carrier protein] reductase|nr:SDR family oxidoreductase [Bacteroidales bacterium]